MKNKKVKVEEAVSKNGNGRRRFLKMSGLAVAGTGLLIGCSDDDDFNPENGGGPDPDPDPDPEPFDLGSGNLGILNYAYALEQLEAAFYQQVLDGSYWMNAESGEKQFIEDVRNHEVIHRDFFKTAINAAVSDPTLVLPQLDFDFSSVDFGSRSAVLGTSVVLEDTGVKAYNGAGKLIDVSDQAGVTYLNLAGKIVSVEARHASRFRNYVNPGSTAFANDDVLTSIDGVGPAFDKALMPSEILGAVDNTGFVTTEFTATNLPTE
jgi:hypothetical protein